MSKPLHVYNMAEQGVNVTKSPVHLDDGELTAAQNIQTDPTASLGAIRRRDGMSKLNSSAMAGSVKGLIALPLPNESSITRTFYAAIDDDNATTDSWRTSTNGSSWSTITTSTLRKAAQTSKSDDIGHPGAYSSQTSWRGMTRWASWRNKVYFPGDDYNSSEEVGTDTPPTVYSWDGTNAIKLFSVPPNPNQTATVIESQAILSLVPYSETELLVSVNDYSAGSAGGDSTVRGRVLIYNTVEGSLEQLGPESNLLGHLFAVFVYQGRIWAVPHNFSTALTYNISWIRPGDTTWTTDAALEAASVGGLSFAEFKGDLYMGTHSSVGVVARIRKRTAATATWSTVVSTDGSGEGQYFSPLVTTADGSTLLAYVNYGNGTAPLIRIVKSTDGSSWSTDLDVVADLGAGYTVPGTPYIDSDGSIYWALRKSDNTGFIKKRTSAGTWSTVDTVNNLRGPIVALRTV